MLKAGPKAAPVLRASERESGTDLGTERDARSQLRIEAEIDCFLEFQGASAAHAEEIAAALSEELDAWVVAGNASDEREAHAAAEVSKQLRLLGWLVSVESGDSAARLMEQLEQLLGRANDVMSGPMVSGIRRKLTPPVGISIAELYAEGDESELTVVKKAKWDQSRSTNRILQGDEGPASTRGSRPDSEPPPTPRRR